MPIMQQLKEGDTLCAFSGFCNREEFMNNVNVLKRYFEYIIIFTKSFHLL
jgi:hypothetical protein